MIVKHQVKHFVCQNKDLTNWTYVFNYKNVDLQNIIEIYTMSLLYFN